MIRFMGAHKTSVCYFLKVAQHMETSVCSIFRARAIAAGDSPCFFLLMISPARLSPSALPSIFVLNFAINFALNFAARLC